MYLSTFSDLSGADCNISGQTQSRRAYFGQSGQLSFRPCILKARAMSCGFTAHITHSAQLSSLVVVVL